MAASCPDIFKTSTIGKVEVQQLVDDHILAPHSVLQWWPAKGEDILTPNTKEIVVMKPFF
jgi:hypothetical protein